MSTKHVQMPVRLAPTGTRVVVLQGPSSRNGIIREVRLEPYLRTYVVGCDDGEVVFVSGHDLAREDDATRTPLAPRPEY